MIHESLSAGKEKSGRLPKPDFSEGIPRRKPTKLDVKESMATLMALPGGFFATEPVNGRITISDAANEPLLRLAFFKKSNAWDLEDSVNGQHPHVSGDELDRVIDFITQHYPDGTATTTH